MGTIESTAKDTLDRADELVAQRHFKDARQLVRPLIKRANKRKIRAAAYAVLGRCACAQDKYYRAIRLLRKARALGNTDLDTFISLGVAYEATATEYRWLRRDSNAKLAKQTLALAQTEHPDNELIAIMNAKFALDEHKWLRAIDTLEPYVADSKNPTLFSIYSVSLRRSGRVKEANSYLLRSVINNVSTATLLGIATHHLNNGEFSDAHVTLKACRDAFPESLDDPVFAALDTAVDLGNTLFGLFPDFKATAEERFTRIAKYENRVAEANSLSELNLLYSEISSYVTEAMETIKARIDELAISQARTLAETPIPSDEDEIEIPDPSVAEQNLLTIKKFGEYMPVFNVIKTVSAINEVSKTAGDLRRQFTWKIRLWRLKAYSISSALILLQLVGSIAFILSVIDVFVDGGVIASLVQRWVPPLLGPPVVVLFSLFWIFFVWYCGKLRKRTLESSVRELRDSLTKLVTNYGPMLLRAEMDLTQFDAALPLPSHIWTSEELIYYALDTARLPVFRCHAFFLWFKVADAGSVQKNLESFRGSVKDSNSDPRLTDYFSLVPVAAGTQIDVEDTVNSYRSGGKLTQEFGDIMRLSLIGPSEEELEEDKAKWRGTALNALKIRGKPDGIKIIERLWDKDDDSDDNRILTNVLKEWPTDDGKEALIDLIANSEDYVDFSPLVGAELSDLAIDKLVGLAKNDGRFRVGGSSILHLLLISPSPKANASGRELIGNMAGSMLRSLAQRLVMHHQKEMLYALSADEDLQVEQRIPFVSALVEEDRGRTEELVVAIADEIGDPDELEYLTRCWFFEALGGVGSDRALNLLTRSIGVADTLTRQGALRGVARAGERGFVKLGEFLSVNPELPADVEIDVRLAQIVLQPDGAPDWTFLYDTLRNDEFGPYQVACYVCGLVTHAAYFCPDSALPDRLFEYLESLEGKPEFADVSDDIRRARTDFIVQLKMRKVTAGEKALRVA